MRGSKWETEKPSSRCGGLLELEFKKRKGAFSDIESCLCGAVERSATEHDPLIDGKVVFMHRTVYEFLSDEKVWGLKCLQARGGFEASTELSLIVLYSVILSLQSNEKCAIDFLRDGLCWGAKSDYLDMDGQRNIFWAIQPFLNSLPPNKVHSGTFGRLYDLNKHNSSPGCSHASLILAAEAGASNYVRQHPEFAQLTQPTAHVCDCLPLLYHATGFPLIHDKGKVWRRGSGGLGTLTKKMSLLLLSHGGDPNFLIDEEVDTITTPWITWLHSCHRTVLDDLEQLEVAEIMVMFLNAGADLVDDLQEWIREEFQKRPCPRVQMKGVELLHLVERLGKGSPASSLGTDYLCTEEENRDITRTQTDVRVDSIFQMVGERVIETDIYQDTKRTRVSME